MRKYRYDVAGTGAFPLEMLAREHAFPASVEDARMIRDEGTTRGIALVAINGPHWQPNATLWRSLGWEVVDV